VALDEGGTTIVVDPGTLTPEAKDAVAGAAAVLITHDHADHFDADLLATALADRPELRVFGTAAVHDKLGDHDGRVRTVSAGDSFTVGEIAVTVFGDRHAVIHPDVPGSDNVGYLIDGTVYHPGDAYFVPDATVETLLLPTSGPWTKLGDAADYVRAVGPRRVIQIHELMLSELGQNSTAMFLGEKGLTGIPLTLLPAGDTVTV
jgi:L-ascorbate metabolism protein UlaG (beta-lactamase superfamily)